MRTALGILIAGLALSTPAVGRSQQAPQALQTQEGGGLDRHAFQDPSAPIESRIDRVLSLMTLDEKVAILGRTIRVPRLGIEGTGIGEALSGVLLGTLYEPLIADAMANPLDLLARMKEAGLSFPLDAAASGSATLWPGRA